MKILRAIAATAFTVLCCPLNVVRAQAPVAPPPASVPQNAVLEVKLKAENRAVPPGKTARVQVEIKNRGQMPVTLSRVQIGDKTVEPLVGKIIPPGKSAFWKGEADPKLPVGKEYGKGTIDLLVESSAGVAGERLDVERLEPFEIKTSIDSRPVFGGAESSAGDMRQFELSVKSRVSGKQQVTVDVTFPAGWSLLEGKASQTSELRTTGEQKRFRYKVLVPIAAPLGEYPILLTVRTPTGTYPAQLTVAVTR